MAESQQLFSYDDDLVAKLDDALSPARLRPYLEEAKGDRQAAIKLYLWNARIAKSFLFPLHVVEITVRNAMNSVFCTHFGGKEWMRHGTNTLYDKLTEPSRTSIDRTIERIERTNQPYGADDIVSNLTFDFWSNLFRRDYNWLWRANGTYGKILEEVFPGAPCNISRGAIKKKVELINRFRNRVAHHEPIHKGIYDNENKSIIKPPNIDEYMLDVLSYRCRHTEYWVRQHSTVMNTWRSRPAPTSNLPGPLLSTIKMVPPPFLDPGTPISECLVQLKKVRPPVALVTDTSATPPFRAITADALLAYIGEQSAEAGNIIDLSEHRIEHVIEKTSPLKTSTVSHHETTRDAIAIFFEKGKKPHERTKVLVVLDSKGTPIGCLTKPEIHY